MSVDRFGWTPLGMAMTDNTGPYVHAIDFIERTEKDSKRIKELEATLDPVKDWYDGDGERTDVVAMLKDAIADLQEDRATSLNLQKLINSPELQDFIKAVKLEAVHQKERWPAEHDANKNPEDWFWLLGYLAGKALGAQKAGDIDKAKHHTISSAAALANWHFSISNQTPTFGKGAGE